MNIIEFGSEDEQQASTIKFLVYGTTGSGKTYSLRTLPEFMRPAIILDCDRGSRALWKEKGRGTAVTFDLEDSNGRPTMYEQSIKFLTDMYEEENDQYKTIIVDSYTLMHQAIMAHVMYKGVKDSKSKRSSADDPPTLPEYGIITHLALKFVQALISLDRHVIMICHETSLQTDEVTGQARGGPALTPKLASLLPRYFDEVLYAKTKGKGDDREYSWATKATGLFEARTRHPELDGEIPQDYGIYVR